VLSNSTTSTATLLRERSVRTAAPYAGLAAVQAQSAPMTATHGTSVPTAGFTIVDRTDANPGSPPREAPV
jgi:hypothetical protein